MKTILKHTVLRLGFLAFCAFVLACDGGDNGSVDPENTDAGPDEDADTECAGEACLAPTDPGTDEDGTTDPEGFAFIASCGGQENALGDGTEYTVCEELFGDAPSAADDCAVNSGTWSEARCPAGAVFRCSFQVDVYTIRLYYGLTADDMPLIQGLCEGLGGEISQV